jgi:transcriptional regulator with XRE-family HTH domain
VNTPILTASQLEFVEIFERLEREFKISKAAVARALRIERSYVTMLISGKRTPHIRILESMREFEKRMLTGRQTEGPAEEETELNQLIKLIKLLEQYDPPKFQTIKQVVYAMAQTSSKTATAASKLLKKTAAPKQKAGAK